MRKNMVALLLLVVLVASASAAVVYYEKVVKVSWHVVADEGLEVSPNGIFFGDVVEGETVTDEITVTNIAETTLNITVKMLTHWLCGCSVTFTPDKFALQPGETQTVVLALTAGFSGHNHVDEPIIIHGTPT